MRTFLQPPTDTEPSGNLDRALADIRAGKFVVLIGTAERRGEGTLTIAAEHCDADAVAYMARHGRGIVSLCLTESRCETLGLRPMTRENTSSYQAAFTVSIEARDGITTGISAADRARTIAVAIDPSSSPRDIVSPGHIFPLRARNGGVLARVAHTEGAVDLAALAGLTPAAVICGILTADGEMAGPDEVRAITDPLGLTAVHVEQLVERRLAEDGWLEARDVRELDTVHGRFTVTAFTETYAGLTHLALTKGDPVKGRLFVHEECTAGDVFGTTECSCGTALADALATLERDGDGVLVYLRRDGSPARLQGVLSAACPARSPGGPKAAAVVRQAARLLGRAVDP
jgi:3,4-dihydroxy 2-butanone 4-phosphate synthase / GTP cyclohydrolase II